MALAVVALASGWIAVRMAGSAVAPSSVPVLSASEVKAQLRQATAASSGSPSASASRTPSDEPSSVDNSEARTFRVAGGTVVAECQGAELSLGAVSPSVGYAIEEQEADERTAEVRFEGSESESRISIECVDGVPVAEVDSGDD